MSFRHFPLTLTTQSLYYLLLNTPPLHYHPAVTIGTTVVDSDEFPRHGTTPETLAKLRPAFIKDGTGTVTAGNASGLNDGAAVVVLACREVAAQLKLRPMAKVVSWAQTGVDPSIMGMGPLPAIRGAVS